MTVSTDELYGKVEQATVASAERRLRARYVEAYGDSEGPRRLQAFLDGMAANIRSDSRSFSREDAAA